MRVLLIEDKEDISRQLSTMLEERGHDVVLVKDFASLRKVGRVTEFDLFVINAQISSFDAFAFLEAQVRLGGPNRTLLHSVTDEIKNFAADLGFRPEQCITNPHNTLALLAALRTLEAAHEERAEPRDSEESAKTETEDETAEVVAEDFWTSSPPSGRIVVLASHKGGTGKTTLAMHLISGLLMQGLKVASIDLDHPQHSLTRYLENRRAYIDEHGLKLGFPLHQSPEMPINDLDSLQRGLREYQRRMNVVVIDCPAGYNLASRTAIGLADTLITPINDSFLDLDLLAVVDPKSLDFVRAGPFGQMVEEQQQRRRQWNSAPIDWIVLRNRLSTIRAQNKERMADALERLALRLGFRTGPGLSERVLYRELFLQGITLHDLRRERADTRLNLSQVTARQEMRCLLKLLNDDSQSVTETLAATA